MSFRVGILDGCPSVVLLVELTNPKEKGQIRNWGGTRRGDCAALWDVLLDTSAVPARATTLVWKRGKELFFPNT